MDTTTQEPQPRPTLTCKQLIEALGKFPADTEIVVYGTRDATCATEVEQEGPYVAIY